MEPMNEPVLKTFVSNDENIQRKRTYKVIQSHDSHPPTSIDL